MTEFSGKGVLVAGGAGYLSIPSCYGFAENGADLMIADRDEARLATLVEDLHRRFPESRVRSFVFDIGDEESIKEVVAETVRGFGRLDVLVNATYSSVGKLVEELTGPEFDATLHVNVTGAFLLAREASRVMGPGAAIVLFSSMYGHISPDPAIYRAPMKPNPIEYGAAKAAIEQMTRYLAVYLGHKSIRVNAVAPGPFPHTGVQSQHPEFITRLAAKVPLGRIGAQNEVADAVLFLASSKASYITGHILDVNGGWTIW